MNLRCAFEVCVTITSPMAVRVWSALLEVRQ